MKKSSLPADAAPVTTPDQVPNAKWQTWALIDAAFKDDHNTIGSVYSFCVNRLQQLVGDCSEYSVKPGPRSFVVLTSDGHWGRGASLAEAAQLALKAGARRSSPTHGVLVLNDATPEVNQMGSVIAESEAAILQLGPLGTVGALINAGKESS